MRQVDKLSEDEEEHVNIRVVGELWRLLRDTEILENQLVAALAAAVLLAIIFFTTVTVLAPEDADARKRDTLLLQEEIEARDSLLEVNRILLDEVRELREEVVSLQEESVRLQEDNRELQGQLQEWLDAWSVTDMVVTAYAPLCPTAVEGMCFSGDPSVTASGARVVPGKTAAAGPDIPFGTRVIIPGRGTYTVRDRGGSIGNGNIDIAVQTREEALAFGRQALRVALEK